MGALIRVPAARVSVASTMVNVPRWARRVVKRLLTVLPATASANMKVADPDGSTELSSAVELTAKQERAWRELARLRKYFVVVLDHKGGVGKSIMVQVTYETLCAGESGATNKILVLDADFVNKNLSRVGLSAATDAVRADKKDFEGFLFEAAEQMEHGLVQGVVVDSAAGSEHFFHRHLPSLASYLKSFGARLIIVRPITTNPLNQDNCINFGRSSAMTNEMGVVMVRNFGLGREPEDYAVWMGSDERREMLEAGMVECDLEGAGALCSDLAAACEVSISDIALKRIEDMNLTGRKLAVARQYFSRRFQLFVGRWMARQTMTFEHAFGEAVRRTFL